MRDMTDTGLSATKFPLQHITEALDAGINWEVIWTCSLLQRVLHCVAERYSVLQRVLQCVELERIGKWFKFGLEGNQRIHLWSYAQCVCCSVLQCVAGRRSVLQGVAVCCSVLSRVRLIKVSLVLVNFNPINDTYTFDWIWVSEFESFKSFFFWTTCLHAWHDWYVPEPHTISVGTNLNESRVFDFERFQTNMFFYDSFICVTWLICAWAPQNFRWNTSDWIQFSKIRPITFFWKPKNKKDEI